MTRRKSLPIKVGGGEKGFTDRHKEIFLKIFEETNSVKRAAEEIGFSRQCIYQHLKKDPDFYEAFEKVNDVILDNLEAEAYRRAVKGVKTPEYYQGRLVGYKLTYSDKLLEMLLRGRSDKYSNKSSIKVEGDVNHHHNIDSIKEKLLHKALKNGVVFDQEPEDAEFEEIEGPREEDTNTDQGEDNE